MRLSTAPDRDDERSIAVVHAALDAGVTLLDTADAYGRDDTEVGHNERLVARALACWVGDRTRVTVATKGGLTRPGGRWVPDGRAKHLRAACEASLRALGTDRIGLYQLHAPDPRVSFATSVRALAALRLEGLVREVGLSNVTLGQIEAARRIVPVAAVQVELSAWKDDPLRDGLVAYCREHGIDVIAYRPFAGRQGARRLANDPAFARVAAAHGVAPAAVALAWLWTAAPGVIPIPGPTRPEHVGELAAARRVALSADEVASLATRGAVPAPRPAPVPTGREPTVVVVMGMPGAGKSTLAEALVADGHVRLNRDEAGGTLAGLLPSLQRLAAAGQRRLVLDNTYASRASRRAVVDAAAAAGLACRLLWLKTGLPDAQANACGRMVQRYGRLLGPEDMKAVRRSDPGAFPPGAQFRYQRELEPPDASEGFAAIEEVPFRRRRDPSWTGRAALFWYDGVLRRSRSGQRSPVSPEDVEPLAEGVGLLHRYRDAGFRLLGLSWQPEIAEGRMDGAAVDAVLALTHALLGVEMEALHCPHGPGPPVCWCRKPLPGLPILFVHRHHLDPARSVFVGAGGGDRSFAARLGFGFHEAGALARGAARG